MDKLQMTVTLSADSAPDLLAYLRQFPGARERAFMLKLLAQRGLQLVLSAGPDTLLRPPTAATTPTVAAPVPPPPLLAHPEPSGARERETAAPYATVAAILPLSPAAAGRLAADRPQVASAHAQERPRATPAPASEPAADGPDPLAGLDLGALNDAMARFG
ncbi:MULTISPECIES: hypothetical protein [Cupriavidus]|uniref:Uncharacterized protein n=1 Tax=Cupriavidus basilensis TaxID=68895 RepID=A0A643FR66_9BURK|nr:MULTISPECIES: hypothetical protein [Cupriavidus]NOV23605.1 hypothetical protein [Cupriavidus necator]QOT81678.1 hypothetical protein F7R26_037325 [Cupriavidus basilensis]BDB30109.1 hypothetical protein CTP10_R75260 [Cupriavidus sp. P-10]